MASRTITEVRRATSRPRAEGAGRLTTGIQRHDSLGDLEQKTLSPRERADRVAKEVALVARLSVKLWSHLGLGWRWNVAAWQLILYATFLMPGMIQVVFYYFFSRSVTRSIIYGREPRNRLDLYKPSSREHGRPWPVVVFVTGGAWTIGYKAWGALLGKRLSEHGILVACLDYRNFPQGNAVDMMEDVCTGVDWVLRHIDRHGGDPENVYLCGQSAGGHLLALALLAQAEHKATGHCSLLRGQTWDPTRARGFIGVSGAYSLDVLKEHLHRRGLYRSLFESIMSLDGKPALVELSPTYCARKLGLKMCGMLPEILLLHGKNDKSVPYFSSCSFSEALNSGGVKCECRLYEGKSHTDPLVDDPLKGGRDSLMEAIVEMVLKRKVRKWQTPMIPGCLASAAAAVCPF
ncbi:unnamed protein product [Ostreobium quekettii]|uniref:protein-S-isoprenylcysteine alpha-carbonyl methylesterase n=1 Tax=Ostreobium quekettii TaxID=121088 RepID=A0A8S1ING8_9CHLO|nr:unnamed protein product [Ostreobium quekettii]|eukprot:evm.model.scf_788EXC.3 EVM.evm.TU.scf_788EXC.3   scf_788EXC:24723-31793(-)